MKTIVVLAAAALVPSAAIAAPITGGETRVEVTADVPGLGLSPGLIGSASLISAAPLTVGFPITGGDLDGSLAGSIAHDGSGLSLTNGLVTLSLENFLIDTIAQTIFGDVSVDGSLVAADAAIFSFDLSMLPPGTDITDLDDPSLPLLVTGVAAGVLTDLFATPNLTGIQFALAATAPQFATEIPEPALIGLFGVGLVGVAALRRRRA
jgi:PEP-CTERM motif